MTKLQQLRAWAEKDPSTRTVAFRNDSANGKWLVNLSVTEPVHFEQGTGWCDTLEAASARAVAWLEEMGEEIPQK